MSGHLRRAPRAALALALAMVVVAAAATVAWALLTLTVRPLDGVEGDVLFEADRLRSGFVLYVDPAAGAYDYGAVPARYLVLYPPLWSAIVSLVPTEAAATFARVLATTAWWGVLAWIAWRAPAGRARTVRAAACAVAGTWVLALYGTSGRPDALAVAACGLALQRTCRKASVSAQPGAAIGMDAAAGVLFGLAAWVKPNVLGAAPGALAGAILASHAAGARPWAVARAVAPGLAGALGFSALAAGVLTLASGWTWLHHLVASTGQPPSLGLWFSQIASRAPFVALPFGLVIAMGIRARRDPGAAIAVSALVTSVAWFVVCLAKIGSASNYLLEPSVAALVVVAHADVGPLSHRARLGASGALLLQAAWNGFASVDSAFEHIALAREQRAALRDVRSTCNVSAHEVVIADEPGLERMMNGRITATPFQSTHLARRQRFPVDAWLADIARPEVTCLVMQDDLLERPLDDVRIEHDRFGAVLRRALTERFVLTAQRGGYRIYRVRGAPEAP